MLAHQPLPEWEWLDAIIALRLNRVQGLRGDRQTASLAAIVARLDALHQAKPADLIGVSALATALVWYGEQLDANGDHVGARAAWQRTVAVLGADIGNSRDKTLLDPGFAHRSIWVGALP